MLAHIPVTLAATAAAAIINIWLAVRVGQRRTAAKVALGDGGDLPLIARMRAHANYTEYTPFVLLLLLALELSIGSSIWLWAVAALYLVARVAHGLGMKAEGSSPLRGFGTLVTMVTLLALAIAAAWTAARAPVTTSGVVLSAQASTASAT